MLQASEQTATQVRFTLFNQLSIPSGKYGWRRIRVVAFEVLPERTVVFIRRQWWNPRSGWTTLRASYNDDDLHEVPGVKDVHVKLVHAVREGNVESFLAKHCGLDLRHEFDQALVRRWYREVPLTD